MQAVYHTNLNELTIDFLGNLKKQFRNAKVDVVIREFDDTDYLNSSAKNKKLLEEAINEVDNNKLIFKTEDELSL